MKRYLSMLLFVIFGAVLMQGFQCASPEYTTAKLALKNKEFPKAEEYFEKELKKNPQNAEAWMFLAETRMYLKKYVEASEAADNAIKYSPKNLKIQMQAMQLKSKLWRDTYMTLIGKLNKYLKTENDSTWKEALHLANAGMKIAPAMFDFVRFRGLLYQAVGDTAAYIRDYDLYYKEVLPSINFAKKHNIFIDIPREDVIKKLGKPGFSQGRPIGKTDSSIVDVIVVDGKEFYMKSVGNNGKFKVQTWRYDPPKSLAQIDKLELLDLTIDPLVELIQYYYNHKNYEKALEVLNSLLVLKPNDEQINNFMITLYDEMGRKDEATKRLQQLIKSDPKNKSFRLNYGNLLMQMERYDDAIKQYEEALKIDPNYYDALRNLASAYKNKAVIIQKRQFEEAKGDKTKMNQAEYLPFIKKSGEYFEKCRKSKKYANDINVMFDLVDIYYVTKDEKKLKYIVAELEAIEPIVPDELKETYYIGMVKVFDQRLPNEEKSQKYMEKVNNLK